MLRSMIAPVVLAATLIGPGQAETAPQTDIITCPETVTTGISSDTPAGWTFPGGKTLRVDDHFVSGGTMICRYEDEINLFHPVPPANPDCTPFTNGTTRRFECTPEVKLLKTASVMLPPGDAVDFETKTIGNANRSADLRLNSGRYLEAINGAKIYAQEFDRLSKSRCADLADPLLSGMVADANGTPPRELLIDEEANKQRYYCLVTQEGNIGAVQFKTMLIVGADPAKALLEYWLWD